MFGLFDKRRGSDPGQFLELVSQRSAPNFFWTDDTRQENRNNRSIPVTISPWLKNRPQVSPIRVAMTKDISNYGICLITHFDLIAIDVVVGIYAKEFELESPLFFQCHVRTVKPIAGGIWQIGLQAAALLNGNYEKMLKEMSPSVVSLLTAGETRVVSEATSHDAKR